MLQRRRFLSAVAITPVVLAIAPGEAAHADDRRPSSGGPSSAAGNRRTPSATTAPTTQSTQLMPPGALSRELELAGDFRVVRAFGPYFGALPFVLEGEGQRFQIDVLRRDASSERGGVFDTERFSLFVHGRAGAERAAVCERGARALGAALERRADEGVAVPALATFAERTARHAGAYFDVDFEPDHSATGHA